MKHFSSLMELISPKKAHGWSFREDHVRATVGDHAENWLLPAGLSDGPFLVYLCLVFIGMLISVKGL